MYKSDNLTDIPRRALSSAIAAILLLSVQATAVGQQQSVAADEAETATDVDEITVTGTRIRRNDFAAPNAVQTLTSEDIDALGIVSVEEMMMQMTSNVATVGLETSGDQSFFVGASMANLRGMNTGFGTRTLTLVDGRRMPPTTNGGAVDLSMIPSVLVGRMETVTGGASATYGSDAMSGVVNIVLNREMEGTRVQAGWGQSGAGDGTQYNFSIANGTRVLNERGHFTVGFEHRTVDPITDCHTARDWCGRSWNYIDNGTGGGQGAPTPNNPNFYDELAPLLNPQFPGAGYSRFQVFEDVRYIHSSPYASVHTDNTVDADPLNGQFIQFTPDGLGIMPYQEGLSEEMRQYAYGGANRRVAGGEGKLLSHGFALRQGSERNNLYTRFVYAVNDHTSVSAELSFNRNEGFSDQRRPGRFRLTHCLTPDNAFRMQIDDPAAQEVLDARAAADTACSVDGGPGGIFFSNPDGLTVYKDWTDQLDAWSATETDMRRLLVSVNGGLFGGRNWNYDAYVQYGETDRSQQMHNMRTNRRWGMAMDAVFDANTGEIVCRVNESGAAGEAARNQYLVWLGEGSLGDPEGNNPIGLAEAQSQLASLSQGCVPLNPLGLDASQEAIDYAWGDLIEHTDTQQKMVSATFSGSFWQGLPAGPAQIATGIDWREDTTDNRAGGDPDPIRRIDYVSLYGDGWLGGTEIGDVFAELEFPLLAGRPGAEYMMVNVSQRRSRSQSYRNYAEEDEQRNTGTRYSDSFKFSWVYDPTSWLRVRTTRSRDVRQPSGREMFFRSRRLTGGLSGQLNPWRTVNETEDNYDVVIGSNPNLRNEESITQTLGFVFTPQSWARGLQFSIDYYRLAVDGGITYRGANDPDNEDNLPFTIFRCFEHDDPVYCNQIVFGPPSEQEPDNPRSNIQSYQSMPENSQPFFSRGFDISAAYSKRLSRGGSFSVRLMATRAIEQRVCTGQALDPGETESFCTDWANVVGQTGGSLGSTNVLSNYTPTPIWSGNLFGTYRRGGLSFTAQARHIGKAQGSTNWVGPDDPRWQPESHWTISMNEMPAWTLWNTSVSYNFGQAGMAPQAFNDLSVSLNIDNVFDKQPNFWSGGHVAGVNTRFYSGMGRTYRLGLRMGF